jgi:hypothetical protein
MNEVQTVIHLELIKKLQQQKGEEKSLKER